MLDAILSLRCDSFGFSENFPVKLTLENTNDISFWSSTFTCDNEFSDIFSAFLINGEETLNPDDFSVGLGNKLHTLCRLSQ